VDAKKNHLETNKISWNAFKDKLVDRKIKSIITDFEVVLSSDKILVLKNDFVDKVLKFNKNLGLIENKWFELINEEIKMIATDAKNWEKEMNNYKEKLKEKEKYTYLPEPETRIDDDISNIFNESKVEIKEE
jgi:hypothetical protein